MNKSLGGVSKVSDWTTGNVIKYLGVGIFIMIVFLMDLKLKRLDRELVAVRKQAAELQTNVIVLQKCMLGVQNAELVTQNCLKVQEKVNEAWMMHLQTARR